MHSQDWHSRTVNNLKIYVLGCSYIQLNLKKKHVLSHGHRIPAPIRSLKSTKVGADITLAGRSFQRSLLLT